MPSNNRMYLTALRAPNNFEATRFLDLFGSSDYSRVTFVGSPRRAGPFVSLASGLGAPAPRSVLRLAQRPRDVLRVALHL